jgi:5-(carboxyamino)imidazole ribonucleotide synthase
MVLHTTQNRLREKSFLASHGLPVTPFRRVESPQDLRAALDELGFPAVLKTAGYGYDGKGQIKITSPEQVAAALASVPQQELVLEAFVDFQCEVSVIGRPRVGWQFR